MQTEKKARTVSGWGMLFVVLAVLAGSVFMIVSSIIREDVAILVSGIVILIGGLILLGGFFIINPNEAAALLLAGSYRGTTRENGFRYANPFYKKMKISLRTRNFNSDRLKVNDLMGNPIEIAVVVVWKITNTAEALFEVDDYLDFVHTQSESAVRSLASAYPYDGHDDELSLRGATEEINHHLQKEVQERLDKAGVDILEARISHLAYAPEIAGAMLQRQQASAVVAARQKIVEGAVGMVEMALELLGEKDMVHFDEDKKATMVSNLLVVLCSEHAAQPVVNTGSLYQ